MVATLRITNVQVIDSSDINISFTETLTPNLVTSNISIISQSANVPNSKPLEIRISRNTLSIVCQPLTPLAVYNLQFQSVSQHPFQSINGDAIISMDGVSNVYSITAPLSPDNPVANYFKSFYNGNIYDAMEDPTSVVSQHLTALSANFSRALYDIGQLGNENYLELDIVDEQHIRGAGPFDRLLKEAAYEITRVGFGPTNATVDDTFLFPIFPDYPITLQRQIVTEILTPNSIDLIGEFNTNSLTLNLSNLPVTRVDSIIFTLITANPQYVYNISTLGYQIQNSRYDQDFASTYSLLSNNQIKLSDKILADPLFSIDNILHVTVQYEYKNLGIIVDPDTVQVTNVLSSTREVLPPIINVFNLQNAPVVDNTGAVATSAGVVFTDPNQATPGALHPAFIYEIPFRLNALPASPGYYSIDYSTGTIYVYGANLNNDGTGPYPPLASYQYLLTYKSEQDYVYDATSYDIVALPPGNLIENNGTINFTYEQVLVPGVDYNSDVHIESLEERVGNNLAALNIIIAQNSPITNVFRIFNETTGEIYTLNRWENNQIYFQFNNAPNIVSLTSERAVFDLITNETLFVNTTLTNSNSLIIFKFLLNNNNIVAGTEDTLGSSFNTSLSLNDGNVFIIERWFEFTFNETNNINRLLNVGDYMVDYLNGIIYVAVSNTQNQNVGSVSYRRSQIDPQFPHLISVNDLYYRISPLLPKNAEFSYTSFGEGAILPVLLNPSDEQFLNNNNTAPYILLNNNIGTFFNSEFLAGVTYQVKFIRSVFEYNDLLNNSNPINFADVSSSNAFNITVSTIFKQSFENVQFDGTHYFLTLNENIPYLSPNIVFNFSVIRASDGAQLWNGSGTVVAGNSLKLVLPGINSPHTGDLVNVNYSFTIQNVSRVVIDYNKGDYFIDYTYLADEIIISYEYGDNVIDFRMSETVSTNDTYYVSYKAGALRDALLKNFGTLVNVPVLANVDLNFDRERYREALQAALSSFIQGPTIAAIKNIGKTISHIEPEVIEDAFQGWTLGLGLLNPEPINTTGNFQLLPAKFGNGVLINSPDQTITFPTSSNLRLEAGTFETWILPQWNGLDNNSTLTFTILKDGYAINDGYIFVGDAGYHPTLNSDGTFSLTKQDNVSGLPNMNKDGVFIYYNQDVSGLFDRWYIQVIDGYVYSSSSMYKITINSTGTIYDNQSIINPKPSFVSFFTGLNKITLNISATSGGINQGLTFVSDPDQYILDFGKDIDCSRLSIYKDAGGYLNFRTIAKDKKVYTVSTNISNWQSNQPHMIAASWQLNTRNNRDEMHLFVDGFEVPNIIKYGQALQPYLNENFRTVDPEEIIGLLNRDIVGSTDLTTNIGSNIVTSSLNFSSYNIFIGDIITINELGFSAGGYIIENINGQTLTLNQNMPLTLPGDGRFSINQTEFTITSEINVVPNIAITTINPLVSGTDMTGSMSSNMLNSSATNFITAGVQVGYSIHIDNNSLEIIYTILQVSAHSLTINDTLSINLLPTAFQIYSNTETEIPGTRALFPSYSISQDVNFNNILTVYNDVFAGDLILLRTYGLNFRNINKKYYVWSTGVENVLMTHLPAPISLDETNITRIILPTTSIGSANSTLIGGQFVSNNLPASQPSNGATGRTLSITLSGTNIDFSTQAQITVNGTAPSHATISETLSFSDYGTMQFSHTYIGVNYVQATIKPINSSRAAGNIEVFEAHPITYAEFDGYAPIIRYSYNIGAGYTLFNVSSNSVRDNSNSFSAFDIGNYLVISSPPSAAGYYIISGISSDLQTLTLQSPSGGSLSLPNFSNGIYQVLDVNEYRSGFQNGYFTFEINNLPGQPYFLSTGYYQLNYSTYASIKFDPLNENCYIGSDLNGNNQANVILNQVKIYSMMLTDTRVGESIPANQLSITKDFNSLKPLVSDSSTLLLLSFNSFPFTDASQFYITPTNDLQHFQSPYVVNENFGQSLVITDIPVIVPNTGILDTKKEGTIEFWLSPLYDTANDPQERTYFDAYGAVLEETISVSDVAVKLSAPASQILSVKLQAGDPNIDYFAGGRLEIDTQRAIQENVVSSNAFTVIVSQTILQVIMVTVVGDQAATDYFEGGSIGTDQKTIYLGKQLPLPNVTVVVIYQSTANNNTTLNTQIVRLNKRLPNQNTPVIVNYIPKGLQGDRLRIFKDISGYINFDITASNTDYIVRAPTRWAANTWHRIKASYKINGGTGNDEMRLFVDGYQWNDLRWGSGTIAVTPIISGAAMPGDGYADGYNNIIMTNIRFNDPINDLFIGTDYAGTTPIFSLLDNFRISNQSRPIYSPMHEPIDINYNSNLSQAFPVTKDLYTTYLMDYNQMTVLNTNFATLVDRTTGEFDFSVNILDDFGIVTTDPLVQQTLETLLNILKPANSRIYISYIT